MEYLFTRLALHLKQAGFRRLSLGMAPLSGLTPTPLAAAWHRIGASAVALRRPLYNFRGLRTFKSKFDPDWQPRYLAASGTVGPFLALADLALLAEQPVVNLASHPVARLIAAVWPCAALGPRRVRAADLLRVDVTVRCMSASRPARCAAW